MAYPRFQRARAHKYARRTSSNISFSSTTWVNLDTALDLTLEAQAGDLIEVSASGLWGNEAAFGALDVVTVVGGAPVTSFATHAAAPTGTTGEGPQAWYGAGSAFSSIGGGMVYPLGSSDVSNGVVLLRLRARAVSAGTKTFYANATNVFSWWAKNLGPVDPN